MRHFTKIGVAALLSTATMASATTLVSPPDQQGWLTPTVSSNLNNQIDLQWGSTELVVNGGFEDDHWYSASQNSTYHVSGAYSLQVPAGVLTSQIVTVEPGATYTISVDGARTGGGIARLIANSYSDTESIAPYLLDFAPTFTSYSGDIHIGANYTSARIWLQNQGTDNGAYFDDVSLKPTNLYVYRNASQFTNTADATLVGTLDGLTATGYSDTGVSGDYWYAVTANNVAHDVTSYMGTAAVPEPASLGLMLLTGGLLLARKRRGSPHSKCMRNA